MWYRSRGRDFGLRCKLEECLGSRSRLRSCLLGLCMIGTWSTLMLLLVVCVSRGRCVEGHSELTLHGNLLPIVDL